MVEGWRVEEEMMMMKKKKKKEWNNSRKKDVLYTFNSSHNELPLAIKAEKLLSLIFLHRTIIKINYCEIAWAREEENDIWPRLCATFYLHLSFVFSEPSSAGTFFFCLCFIVHFSFRFAKTMRWDNSVVVTVTRGTSNQQATFFVYKNRY